MVSSLDRWGVRRAIGVWYRCATYMSLTGIVLQQMWVAASMVDPLRMKRKSLTSANVWHLVKPLLGKLVSSALVDRMVGKLSEYDKACEDLDWSNDTYQTRLINIETFWGKHRLLPAWTEFAHLVLLLQPSTACVERSFSMHKYIMGDQRSSSMQDKIEASLMLRYNRGTIKWWKQ